MMAKAAQLKKRYAVQKRNPGATISVNVRFIYQECALIMLGNGVYIGDNTVVVVMTDSHSQSPVPSLLLIDVGTYIGESNTLRAAGGKIHIGKKCLISQFVTMIASNHGKALGRDIIDQSWDINQTGIFIEDNVWVGADTIILPGVHVGKNAIIGAGSLIRNDVPDNVIIYNQRVTAEKIRTRSYLTFYH